MNDLLENVEKVILLYDLYGDLLTDKQKMYLSLYYEEDLSLGEISEEKNVSRSAVYDNIKRAVHLLEEYEEKLQLLKKHQTRMKLIDTIEKDKQFENETLEDYLEMLRRL